jgi:hypothetical protein
MGIPGIDQVPHQAGNANCHVGQSYCALEVKSEKDHDTGQGCTSTGQASCVSEDKDEDSEKTTYILKSIHGKQIFVSAFHAKVTLL